MKRIKKYLTLFSIVVVAPFLFLNSGYNFETTNNTSIPVPAILDTITLPANPGPANNGGSPGWAMFLNLIAGTHNITVTQMSTANNAAVNASFSVEIFTRVGTALGGPVSGGPGSSPDGWTSRGTVPVTQGTTANGISLIFNLPPIAILAGDTVGVAIKFTGAGPRYYGSGSPPYSNYADSNLTVITGDGRSAPFTPTGSFFASRALCGVVRYVVNTISGVGKIGTEIPDGYKLGQNYPNPFNPATTIEFAVPVKSNLTLKVFNQQGQEVAKLVNGEYTAGTYRVNWDATGLASGVYFYSLRADNFTQTKKMLLVK